MCLRHFWLRCVSVAACGLPLFVESVGRSLVAAHGLLIVAVPLVAACGLYGVPASVAVAGQGSLACFSPRGHRELGMTE